MCSWGEWLNHVESPWICVSIARACLCLFPYPIVYVQYYVRLNTYALTYSHILCTMMSACVSEIFLGGFIKRKTSLDMICMVHPTNIQKTVTVTFAVIGHLFEGYRAIHFPNGLMGCISQAESPAVLYCGLGGYLAWGRSLWWPMGFGAAKIRV